MKLFNKKKQPKISYAAAKYLFAKAFFNDCRPGVKIGVIAGREQVNNFMRGAWLHLDPISHARKILSDWGAR